MPFRNLVQHLMHYHHQRQQHKQKHRQQRYIDHIGDNAEERRHAKDACIGKGHLHTDDCLRLVLTIGNTAMFIPLGIVWPSVYNGLNKHWKVLAAGIGFSLFIEILQLPFYDRVSDVDDLLLNSAGFLIGYLVYLLVNRKAVQI